MSSSIDSIACRRLPTFRPPTPEATVGHKLLVAYAVASTSNCAYRITRLCRSRSYWHERLEEGFEVSNSLFFVLEVETQIFKKLFL